MAACERSRPAHHDTQLVQKLIRRSLIRLDIGNQSRKAAVRPDNYTTHVRMGGGEIAVSTPSSSTRAPRIFTCRLCVRAGHRGRQAAAEPSRRFLNTPHAPMRASSGFLQTDNSPCDQVRE